VLALLKIEILPSFFCLETKSHKKNLTKKNSHKKFLQKNSSKKIPTKKFLQKNSYKKIPQKIPKKVSKKFQRILNNFPKIQRF
jgi:hypothetical protein